MAQPPAPPINPKLQLSPKAIKLGIERLEKCISDLTAFDTRVMLLGESPQLTSIELAIRDTLERSFGENTSAHYRYIDAANLQFGGIFDFLTGNATTHKGNIPQSIARSVALLKAAQSVLKEDLADHEHSIEIGMSAEKTTLVPSNRVFVVHGHDEGARETVARFLMQLGFDPIILHEQANLGRTVMEKVEAHGDVGFAVVLLTPDDEGCARGGIPEPRARQNVLLELGYFLGRLGRDKVCALKRGNVEIPSDFAGVVWESMEGNGWKQALGRELQAAGHEIDWNKVMRA